MSIEYFYLTGRIVLDDDGAHVVFDSDDEMLSVHPDDVMTESSTVPQYVAYSEGVDGDQIVVDIERDYPVAAVSTPGAKVVRGLLKVVRSTDPGPTDNIWVQAGGTHIDVIDGVSVTTVPQSDLSGYDRVAVISGYTLYVNDAGVLMLKERVVMRARDRGSPPAGYRYRRDATIEFRLLIGFFLGADFSAKPAIGWVGAEGSIGSATQFNGTIDFGPPFPGRRLFVGVIVWNAATAISSVTIGGAAATVHSQAFTGYGSANIASVASTSGSSISVNVTMASSIGYGRLFFFVGRNVDTFIGVSASNTNSATLTTSMDVSGGYAGVTLGSGFNSAHVGTMSGVTQFHNHASYVGFFGLTPTGPQTGDVVATGIYNIPPASSPLAFMAGFRFGV